MWFKVVAAWQYVVLDEGHKIKNFNTKISRSLQSLQAEYRLILTGTPLQNNLIEMWSIFHWLLPDIFAENTLQLFRDSFNLTKGHVNRQVMDDSRRLLELIMIRRMKSTPGVDLNLPPKKIVRLFVPLTELQKEWYLQLITQQSDDILEDVYRGSLIKDRNAYSREDSALPSDDDTALAQHSSTANEFTTPTSSGKDSWRRLLNLVLQLRKVCTHAYLMPDAAPHPNIIGPHIFENSGKFAALHKIITELVLKQGKKMIIFSNFTEVLDWTHDLVTYISEAGRHFDCIRLDGNVLRAKRNLYVRLFQQQDSRYKVFLISTKAGGIGLNLTAATEAVFIDEDWNPQVDLQAEARCHRIGQTKPVTIYKLCTAGSVEEQMLGRIHKKLYLSAKITESMQNIHDTPSRSDYEQMTIMEGQKLFGSYSDFKSLLRRGTQTLAADAVDSEDLLKWDFKTMIEKCQRKVDPSAEESDVVDEEKWLSTMEKVECAVFDGKRHEKSKTVWKDEDMSPSSSRAERRIGMQRTVQIDGFDVDKKSLECNDWESVPTLSGKDPTLRNPKRNKIQFGHQDHCQVCYQDTGNMIKCPNCPRVYHDNDTCMDREDRRKAKDFGNWSCFQHHCTTCLKRAAEAGGVIFRCRWCPNGYCEDCLNWDAVKLIGDTIDEYKVLDFPVRREAYFIACPTCNEEEVRVGLDEQAKTYARLAEDFEKGRDPNTGECERDETAGAWTGGDSGVVKSIEALPGSAEVGAMLPSAHFATATSSMMPSPTPDLVFTARPTPEGTRPGTPHQALPLRTAIESSLGKRKEESINDEHAAKKQKRDRCEIEI